jgi:dTDP-4-dehydrorhamnose 3,5-epimerase
LYIPPGFAHGFCTLEDNTLFSYKCTALYHKEAEGCLLWNDPILDINWELNETPLLSPKDELGLAFDTFASPFE